MTWSHGQFLCRLPLPRAIWLAAHHTEECKMAIYVADQNIRLGLAPSIRSLQHRWGSRRAAYPEAAGQADFGTVAEPNVRKRMQMWRACWGARIGTVHFRKELPPGEAQGKAGHKIGLKSETKIGIKKRDQKWAPRWPLQ